MDRVLEASPLLDWTCKLLSVNHQYSVIWDSHTLSDWNLFWNPLKNEQLQTKNYDAKSNISNSSPGNVGNCLLESPSLKISQGGMPRTPSLEVGASSTQPSQKILATESPFHCVKFSRTHTSEPTCSLPKLNICCTSPPAEPLHPVLLNATKTQVNKAK